MTGRYITHGAGKLVRVTLDDGNDLVGTAQHPIWSESLRCWTPLGELLPGEQLRGRTGPLAVLAATPLPGVADVYNLEIHGQHVYAITPAGVLVHNASECRVPVVSRIKESPKLIRGAEAAGRSAQDSLDGLTNQLSRGNLNPGIGTKSIGKGILEARARDGARVYFRQLLDGTIEILGKSTKNNQAKVIAEVLNLFGG